jgi:hypothetical protein
MILLAYMWLRGAFSQFSKMIVSSRFDILTIALLGALSAAKLTAGLNGAY